MGVKMRARYVGPTEIQRNADGNLTQACCKPDGLTQL